MESIKHPNTKIKIFHRIETDSRNPPLSSSCKSSSVKVIVLSQTKTACEVSEHIISDHFVDVNKTIQMTKGASKEAELRRARKPTISGL
jgi:hypothetical protein